MNIETVMPSVETRGTNGEILSVEFTAALVKISGRHLPKDVCAFKFRGKWYNRASKGEASDYDRRFESGRFLP